MVMFRQDTRRSPLMQQALALMGNSQPVTNVPTGILSATRSIAGALMAKKAEEKEMAKRAENNAAIAAMLAGGNAKPWVNPDTGKSVGTAGGMDGMLAALRSHSDTDVAAQMVPQLQLAKIDADRAKAQLAEQRTYEEGQKQDERAYQALLAKQQRGEKLKDDETAFLRQAALEQQRRLTRLGDKRDELEYASDLAARRDLNNRRVEVGLPPVSGSQEPGAQAVSTGAPEMTIPEAKAQNEVNKKKALAAVDAEVLAKKNKTAFDTFDVGMKAVEAAMSKADTGPFVGRLPALTPEDQTAEGSVAAMAPVLKSLFRTSGEGTFTDKDQDLLMGMIPTRTDHPEARKAKAEMIYSIVRAKLGVAAEPVSEKPTPTPDVSFKDMSDDDLQRTMDEVGDMLRKKLAGPQDPAGRLDRSGKF